MDRFRIQAIGAPEEPAPPSSSQAETDSDLIVRSYLDPECFALLFDRHFVAIHAFVARRLGRNLADDLAAETFLVAFDGRIGYDKSRPGAAPWLYGIASNLVARHKRAEERRYRAIARSASESHAPAAVPDIDSRLDAAARRGALAEALAGLAERDRSVLLLVAWADLSCDEVAQALGIPPGTARSRLHRSRKRLKAVLHTGDDGTKGVEQI